MLLKNREQTILKLQAIDDEGPGTALRDFSTLLSYIGSDGIQVSGKHHFLPLKRLAELNATMVKPVELALKLLQQKSYPHIDGLHLIEHQAMQMNIQICSGHKTLDQNAAV